MDVEFTKKLVPWLENGIGIPYDRIEYGVKKGNIAFQSRRRKRKDKSKQSMRRQSCFNVWAQSKVVPTGERGNERNWRLNETGLDLGREESERVGREEGAQKSGETNKEH